MWLVGRYGAVCKVVVGEGESGAWGLGPVGSRVRRLMRRLVISKDFW
jgi:hypothetical protein